MDDAQQGTDEWHQARLGKVTASRIADVMAKTKSGASASRARYMGQLIAERLTGEPSSSFTNAAMQWGTDTEPQARTAYEFAHDVTVQQVGFVTHPTLEDTGASPDGLVEEDGLVEIKCPETHTHLETILSGKIDRKYILQMQWQMMCTNRKWCDFVSYDPRMPAKHQMFTKRVPLDPDLCAEIEREVSDFLAELKEKITQLEGAK